MCAWVHAASISGASRRRRRQSVAAPPSAPAITPPALTPFLTLSLSFSFLLLLLLLWPRVALSLRFSIRLSIGISLPRIFASSDSLSPSFRHRRARNLRKSSRRHPLHRRLPSSFGVKELSRILLSPRAVATVPGTLISLLLPPHGMTRAGHVPYCCWRMDRVTEALFCVNFAIWKFLYEDSEVKERNVAE